MTYNKPSMMMTILINLGKAFLTMISLYIAVFFFWILLMGACTQDNSVGECQQNDLSRFMIWSTQELGITDLMRRGQ